MEDALGSGITLFTCDSCQLSDETSVSMVKVQEVTNGRMVLKMLMYICRHENTSGFYRVSSYFLSTVVCDVIPMRLVPTLVFSAIVYFMMGENILRVLE